MDLLSKIEEEWNDLGNLGLTTEEIEGYIEFNWESFFPPVNERRLD